MESTTQRKRIAMMEWVCFLIDRFRLTRLGLLLKNHKKDFVGAEDAYKKALAIDPTHAKAWYNFGILLDDKKDVDCHPADSQIIPHNGIYGSMASAFLQASSAATTSFL